MMASENLGQVGVCVITVFLECCFDIIENSLPFRVAIESVTRKEKVRSFVTVETFQSLF